MKKLLILCLTFTIATELEVDGDLKVTGSVDASGNPITNVGTALSMTDAINGNVLQSALRDDGTYEHKIYAIKSRGNYFPRKSIWWAISNMSIGRGNKVGNGIYPDNLFLIFIYYNQHLIIIIFVFNFLIFIYYNQH